MKHLKFKIVFLANLMIILGLQPSFAGSGASGGGDVVLCGDKSSEQFPSRVFLADFFWETGPAVGNGIFVYNERMRWASSVSEGQIHQIFIEAFNRYGQENDWPKLGHELASVIREQQWLYDNHLEEIDDDKLKIPGELPGAIKFVAALFGNVVSLPAQI